MGAYQMLFLNRNFQPISYFTLFGAYKEKFLTIAGFLPKGASALKTFLGELIDILFLSDVKFCKKK